MPIHLSVFMGPFSRGPADDCGVIDMCLDQAVRCADAGIAMVTFGEQHFSNYEPYCNPFMMAARLAPYLGETYFGTTIVPLPLHHPLRLAEDSNIADLLLRGRFVMGMSASRAYMPDLENFGLDGAHRDEIFAAKLDYLLRARRQKPGDPPLIMDSPWDNGRLLGRMMPISWRRGGAQLAIGTNTDATIARFAKLGWPLFLGPSDPVTAAGQLAEHRRIMTESGVPGSVAEDAARKSLMTRHVFVGKTEEEAWDSADKLAGGNPMLDRKTDPRSLLELSKVDPDALRSGAEPLPRNAAHVRNWMMGGTPDQIIAQLAEFEQLGFRHLNIRFTVGTSIPELVEKSFRLFVDEVLPHIDSPRFPALTDEEIEPAHLGLAPDDPPVGPPPGVAGPGPVFDPSQRNR